ncbi:protein Fmp27p, mitochondrial [Monosporozyma servazzii]
MAIISLFKIIPKWVWTTLIILLSAKYCLWFLTGINITYFNPLKFKFSFIYKDAVEVKNIQIIPLQRKIIVGGLNVNKLPRKRIEKSKKNTEQEQEQEQDAGLTASERLLNEITVPKWVGKHYGLLKFLFQDFRIALNHINLIERNFKLVVFYFVLDFPDNKLKDSQTKQISLDFLIKGANWNNEDICSELYLTLTSTLEFKPLLDNGKKSKLSFNNNLVDVKLGKVQVPMKVLLSLQNDNKTPLTPSTPIDCKAKKSIEEAVMAIIQNLNKAYNVTSLIGNINLTMEKFIIKDYALTTNSKIIEINKFLSYHVSISNLTFNMSRFKPGMPGYQLIFKDEDTPFKLSLTLSSFNVCLNMKRQSEKDRKLVKVLEVPNIYLFGETNIFSQTFKHDYGDTVENGVLNLKGSISSPTFEIDVINLSFLKSFKKNIKVFKQAFQDPVTITCGDNQGKVFKRNVMLSFFRSFLPLINIKVTVDEPRMVIKEGDNLIVTKLCTLLIIGTSKRSICSPDKNCSDVPLTNGIGAEMSKEDYIVYESHLNFELINLQMQHTVKDTLYKNTFFSVNSLTLRYYIKMVPHHIVSLLGELDSLQIDLSELSTIVMLNQIIKKLDCQIANVELNYFKPLYEKFASKIKSSEDKCSLISKTLDEETILPSAFLFQALPQFFDYFKIDIKKFRILLGARSVFMPPDIFSSTESQSSHDLVDGKLRKFCLTMNHLEIALSGNYTQWRNKYTSTFVGMTKSGETSAYRSYGSDGLDDISTSESTEIGYLWSFNVLIDDITCSVIGEAPDATDELTARTVSRLSVLAINVYPDVEGFDSNQNKKIVVQINNKKLKSVFSLMNSFLVISGIHTLHQIFRTSYGSSKHESWAKKYLITIAQSQKKSCLKLIKWKEVLSYLEITFGSERFNQICSFPNGLKANFELFAVFVNIKNLKDIEVNGENFRMCVESPTKASYWERFIIITKFLIKTNLDNLKSQKDMSFAEAFEAPPAILLQNESWHFSVPHNFELHRLIDNFSTVIKTIKQMMYSFRTSKNNLIIFPSAVQTNAIPKIKLKSQRYIFSIMDDPFEAEMNMIFQIGLQEQRERLAKRKEFDEASLKKLRTKHVIDIKSGETVSELINIKRLNGNVIRETTSTKKGTDEPLITTPFNIDGKPNIRNISLAEAINEETEQFYDKLQQNNSTSWIRRVQSFSNKEKKMFEKNFSFLWGNINYDLLPSDVTKKVKNFSMHPFLSNLIMEDIDVDICRPSCGIENIPDFIYNVGKGVPKDTEYSIMIPLNINAQFSEIRWHLRDYPLPFINVPPLTSTQSREKCSLQIQGDIIVAEDMIRSNHELRTVFVPLVPSIIVENTDEYYSLKVPRTVTSVKFFNDLKFSVNTKETTQIHIGSSYQPAIQQTMQCLENISKPPLDPSRKTGFWDKIRYLFHGKIQICWPNGGNFEVAMKGSKSPYKIGGDNAGFVLGFGGDIVLDVNEKDDPKQFLSCASDKLYFSVPNYFAKPLLVYSRPANSTVFIPNQEDTNLQNYASYYYMLDLESRKDEATDIQSLKDVYIEKTVIKLTGGVVFNLGMVFERMVDGKSMNNRTFDSKPHYDVRITNPIYVPDLNNHDSYAGFRSEFIHMSFTLLSKAESAYNAMQLSPSTLDIFFKWWQTFSGNFPVRRGKLFNVQSNAPKFGEHIYSISYHADARPFFITDMVHNIDSDRHLRRNFLSSIEFAGIKGKTDKFVMDLHQRKELLTTYNATLDIRKRVKKLKFNEGKVLMKNIDVRTVHGKFRRLQYVEEREDAKYEIFDNDMSWIDITDFQEPHFVDIYKYLPHIFIRPFMFAPNFMYEKQASFGDNYQLDPVTYTPIKPFVNHVSHDCVLNEDVGLSTEKITERARSLTVYKASIEKKLAATNDSDKIKRLKLLIHKAQAGLDNLDLLDDDFSALCYEHQEPTRFNRTYNVKSMELLDISTETNQSFDNKFFIFHMLLKWNENIRNVLLKFLHYNTLANEFSSLASKKSYSIFEEVIKQRMYEEEMSEKTNSRTNDKENSNLSSANENPQERVGNNDEDQRFDFNSNDINDLLESCIKLFEKDIISLPDEINSIVHKNTFIQFIIPQVQLTTQNDPNSCVIITSPNIVNKMVSFEPLGDDVNVYYEERFLKRFGCVISKANAFILDRRIFKDKYNLFFDMNSYGQVKGSEWPPWLGIELAFQNDPLGDAKLINDFSTVIQSQTLLPFASNYEKVKTVLEDKLTIHLPHVLLTATSENFAILYKMYQNLINYEEPEKKLLNEQIDKMAMGFDMNDCKSIHETVESLYNNYDILALVERELTFRRQILDDLSSIDLSNVHNERKNHLLRLYMLKQVMESSKMVGKGGDNGTDKWNILRIKISEIKLRLLHDNRSEFMDININKLIFKKSTNITGFTSNQLNVNNMDILTLDDDARYEYLLKPFNKDNKIGNNCSMSLNPFDKSNVKLNNRIENPLINLIWEYDKPVGGIKVINNVDILLSGLNVQLEDETVTKLVEWLNIGSINRGLKELREREDKDDAKLNKEFKKLSLGGKNDDDDDDNTVNITEQELNPDIDEMVQRSINYMIIEKMVFNKFELNISYRGHGKKRLINVTDFLFTFPRLVFDNQVMKFVDIVHALRRVLVRVLLKHTGKFLGTKLTRRASTKLSNGEKKLLKYPTTTVDSMSKGNSSLSNDTVLTATTSGISATPVTDTYRHDQTEGTSLSTF